VLVYLSPNEGRTISRAAVNYHLNLLKLTRRFRLRVRSLLINVRADLLKWKINATYPKMKWSAHSHICMLFSACVGQCRCVANNFQRHLSLRSEYTMDALFEITIPSFKLHACYVLSRSWIICLSTPNKMCCGRLWSQIKHVLMGRVWSESCGFIIRTNMTASSFLRRHERFRELICSRTW
jgi:hypothetical protein